MTAMSWVAGLQVLVPAQRSAEEALDALASARNLPPFSEVSVAFAKDLSDAIMRSPEIRRFPESVAFGYWMRGARLKQMADVFSSRPTSGILTARGIAFHIAPSNVDTIFLYSLLISILVGNRNIVRLSSKESEQVSILLRLMRDVLEQPQHSAMRDRVVIIRYEHSDDITQALTNMADIRVVWGGDATVNAIRKLPLPPRSVELTFADKVSLAVIDAAAYRDDNKPSDVAKRFANDAYWFGQMACSSPRIVVWRGSQNDMEVASRTFWQALEAELQSMDPKLSVMDYMNKLVAEQTYATTDGGLIWRGATNQINVVRVNDIARASLEDHCGGGLFLEGRVGSLTDLKSIVTPRHQTVASYGISRADWQRFISQERPSGIDRIVPIGEALTFSSVWDGLDLFNAFCRDVTIAA